MKSRLTGEYVLCYVMFYARAMQCVNLCSSQHDCSISMFCSLPLSRCLQLLLFVVHVLNCVFLVSCGEAAVYLFRTEKPAEQSVSN